jgi:hypothetical protein
MRHLITLTSEYLSAELIIHFYFNAICFLVRLWFITLLIYLRFAPANFWNRALDRLITCNPLFQLSSETLLSIAPPPKVTRTVCDCFSSLEQIKKSRTTYVLFFAILLVFVFRSLSTSLLHHNAWSVLFIAGAIVFLLFLSVCAEPRPTSALNFTEIPKYPTSASVFFNFD